MDQFFVNRVVLAAVLGLVLSGCFVVAEDSPPSRPVVVDPVCGAAIDPSTPWRGRFRDQIYYFHSDRCRERFFSAPEAYVGRPYRRDEPRVYRTQVYYPDPVCGREVASRRWRSDYGGRTYYFHDNECRMEFQYRPQAYVHPYRKEDRRYDAR